MLRGILSAVRVVRKRIREDLKRDVAIELRIARAIDLPIPSSAIRAVTS